MFQDQNSCQRLGYQREDLIEDQDQVHADMKFQTKVKDLRIFPRWPRGPMA